MASVRFRGGEGTANAVWVRAHPGFKSPSLRSLSRAFSDGASSEGQAFSACGSIGPHKARTKVSRFTHRDRAIFPPAVALGRTLIQATREIRSVAREEAQASQTQPAIPEPGKTDTEG